MVEERISCEVLKRGLTELPQVLELTSLAGSEAALSSVLDTISSKALETLGADRSSLFLYDPQINKLRCVSLRGTKNEYVSGALVEMGTGVAGWVMRHGKPLLLDDKVNEREFKDFVKKEKKINASLCLPLMVKNQPRGVLNITIFDQKRKFSETDLKLASVFAENAAIAIDKAGLYEKLKKQTKTLKSLIHELKSTQDRPGVQQRLKALSSLANGMSRDFNNVLTAILERSELLLKEIKEQAIPENARQNLVKWLTGIEQLASDGAETARHIQEFTKTYQAGSEKDFEELNVNAIVPEAGGENQSDYLDLVKHPANGENA
jgi:transcriptional regulator with GAF, ATPase, and Fis domain